LKQQAINGQLYFKMLSALGFSLLQQGKWSEAVNIYSMLQKTAVGSKWEFVGFRQKLYCMIMGGELIKSRQMFSLAEKYSKNPDFYDIELLSLLQMVQEKKFSELKKVYGKVTSKLTPGANALLFNINRAAARHYLQNNKPSEAVFFLKEAFKFAPVNEDRKNVLRELINTYVAAKNQEAAIATALKYIEFYSRDSETVKMQFQCARLMTERKMFKDAAAIYSAIIKNPKTKNDFKLRAAYEAAALYEQLKLKPDAVRMLYFIYEHGQTADQKMEGILLLGKLYYMYQKFDKASAAFMEVGSTDSKWQAQGQLWAIQSLIQQKKFNDAMTVVNSLAKNKREPLLAEDARYFEGLIQERTGKKEQALKTYLNFAGSHPENKHAPSAMFDAGMICFELRDFKQAAVIFLHFAKRYPKHDLAPNALYRCVYAYYFLKDPKKMNSVAEELIKKYPASDFASAVEFWLIDLLRADQNYAEAEQKLLKMQKLYSKNSALMAQILYDRARIAEKQNEAGKAVKLLEQLFSKYPESKATADALFMAGNITSAEGKYEKSVVFYRRAAQLRPDSEFASACIGRVADCNYSLYSRTFDSKYLKVAEDEYLKLLKQKKISFLLKNQTHYKLGRCYEMLGEDQKALDQYNELIYGYDVDRQKGKFTKPVWTVKAAYAAIMMYLKQGTPEAAAEAIKVYRLLKSMNLKTGEDFEKFIKNIRSKYRI
jgi:TolA-binding protein